MKFMAIIISCIIPSSAQDPQIKISGKIVDASGSGKAGVTVHLINADLRTTTNEQGEWVIENRSSNTLKSKETTSAKINSADSKYRRFKIEYKGHSILGKRSIYSNYKIEDLTEAIQPSPRSAMQMNDTFAFGWNGSVFLRDTISEMIKSGVVRRFDTTPNPNVIYGYFTDDRDNKVYRYINVKNTSWMAENLNYDTIGVSMCLYEKSKNCGIFGRLYNWTTAKNICPSGWHLPDTSEWSRLEAAVGGGELACTNLESTVGWYNPNGKPNDVIGFSALPAGFYDSDWRAVTTASAFWVNSSSDEYSFTREYSQSSCGYSRITRPWWNSMFVRCVKN